MELALLELAAFRTHLLLAHDVVGTIISDKPTWPGLTVEGGIYRRHGRPVLSVARHEKRPGETKVVVLALTDVWLQEPGLSVKVARADGTSWRGYGPTGEWTSPPYTLKHELEAGKAQAYRSTVHFPRVKTNPYYTVGVEYRHPDGTWRFRSDGGFTKLLDNVPPAHVPWERCDVFGQGYKLKGVCPTTSQRSLRRWELASHPTFDWMHYLGWSGGAGAVVNKHGRTPPPGMDVTAADGYDRLWDPRSWRRLGKGQTITQTVWMRHL